jgi:hypothetical protein
MLAFAFFARRILKSSPLVIAFSFFPRHCELASYNKSSRGVEAPAGPFRYPCCVGQSLALGHRGVWLITVVAVLQVAGAAKLPEKIADALNG